LSSPLLMISRLFPVRPKSNRYDRSKPQCTALPCLATRFCSSCSV
jgi:hypothetical protein